jgi:CheY-like chemotaxis protein
VIATNIELGAELTESAAAKERLEAGLRAVARGHQITQRLLAFSRRRPVRTVVADLRQKLPELMEFLEPSIGRQVSLELGAAADLWPVEVDDGELQVALLNLVVNARDAMPEGGTVRLDARNLVLPAGERPAALQGLAEEVVALTVSDEGSGIPPTILGRVFEPFFTTKGEGQGSGLGLAQVYGFAKQSNGAVTVESELGRGTRFTLYLPRAAAAGSAASPSWPVSAVAPGESDPFDGQPRILVVDDDHEAADAAAALLTRLGCSVRMTDRPRRALGLLAAGPHVDLVFSDIVMPGGMDGIEFAAVIEHRYPGLPVLLTSGSAEKLQVAAEAGREVLQKPYTAARLRNALDEALQAASLPRADAARRR